MSILARRPARDLATWANGPGFLAPAAATLPIAVGIAPAAPAAPARRRAPKGGAVVAGRSYRGGTYLPAAGVVEAPPEPIPAPTPAPAPVASPTRFAIHGFVYTARVVPAGECGTVAVEVHRPDTNHTYHVVRDRHGLVKCDCGDYLSRHDGTGEICKHGRKLVELGMVPAPSPVASTLDRREFPSPRCSVARSATPDRLEWQWPRPRSFEPSPAEMAEAAQLLADAAVEPRAVAEARALGREVACISGCSEPPMGMSDREKAAYRGGFAGLARD